MLPSRKLVAAFIAAQSPLIVEAADRLCTNDDGQVYALELELPFHHKSPFFTSALELLRSLVSIPSHQASIDARNNEHRSTVPVSKRLRARHSTRPRGT